MIKVKNYKSIFKILFVSFFATLVVIALVFSILSSNTSDENMQFICNTIAMCCCGVFWLILVLCAVLSAITKNRIERNLKSFIEKKEYDAAIDFLADYTKRRRTQTISQLILCHLGYVEMFRDNTDAALYYLQQVKIKKYNGATIIYAVQAIGYLYIIYKFTGNEGFNEIRQIYISKRDSFEKLLSKSVNPYLYKIDKLYLALRHLEEGQSAPATEELAYTPYIKIPLINRFYDETHKVVD